MQLAAHALVPLNAAELRYCSPTVRSRATAQALGFAPMAQPALRDCDMGRWRGYTLAEVTASEPAAVDRWFADARSAPHGGESLLGFITRIGSWLDTRPAEDGGTIVAVAEPSVVRAALVYALKAPPTSYWRWTSARSRRSRWPARQGAGVCVCRQRREAPGRTQGPGDG